MARRPKKGSRRREGKERRGEEKKRSGGPRVFLRDDARSAKPDSSSLSERHNYARDRAFVI